jgi:hypothetical protein
MLIDHSVVGAQLSAPTSQDASCKPRSVPRDSGRTPDLSVVIPLYNEAENVEAMFNEL